MGWIGVGWGWGGVDRVGVDRCGVGWGVTNHWTGLLDWTTGLDYWTQNITTKSHFPAVTTIKIYCQSSSKAVPLAARAIFH